MWRLHSSIEERTHTWTGSHKGTATILYFKEPYMSLSLYITTLLGYTLTLSFTSANNDTEKYIFSQLDFFLFFFWEYLQTAASKYSSKHLLNINRDQLTFVSFTNNLHSLQMLQQCFFLKFEATPSEDVQHMSWKCFNCWWKTCSLQKFILKQGPTNKRQLKVHLRADNGSLRWPMTYVTHDPLTHCQLW